MNKNDLVAIMSERAEMTKKQAESAIKAILEGISTAIRQHGKIMINGLGTFTATPRAERKGRNPATGKEMLIPATIVPGFKASPLLKSLLNEALNK